MATIFAQGMARVLRVISTVLPCHTKRLILWSALYGKMCGAQVFTKEQGERLNATLSLCKDTDALVLPSKLSKYIWKELDSTVATVGDAIRNGKTSDAVAMEFIRSIPKWLHYASDAFMLKDFKLLLSAHQRTYSSK